MNSTAEIRLYVIKKNGKVEEDSLSPFGHYGTCPNVGDTICKSWSGEKRVCYSVQRRYFVDNHDSRQGWVVILREIEISPQIELVVKTWEEDEEFWAEVDAKDAAKEREERDLHLEMTFHPERFEPIQPPLNHREQGAMERLANVGAGRNVNASSIPKFGPTTRRELLDRGYIEFVGADTGKAENQVRLTKKGRKDWKALVNHRNRHPHF